VPTFAGTAFVGLGLALLAYVGWLAIEPRYHYSPVLNGWAVDVFEALVALLCIARVARPGPGRGAALFLGLGLLSWTIGDTIFTTATIGAANAWGPTWADAFWLAFYPPAYVGVVLFVRRDVRRIAEPSWLDGSIAALGAATMCASFAFADLHLAGTNTLTTLTYVGYPLGDLLLFALVVGSTSLLSGRISLPSILLAVAMALNAIGDTFNLFQSSLGTPHSDALFRALAWPTAGLLVCLALWVRPAPRDLAVIQRPAGFVLPGSAAVAAMMVLVVGSFHTITRIALLLATLTLVAVAIRMGLSARRLRAFTTERLEQSLTDDLTGLHNRRHLINVLDAFLTDTDGSRSSRLIAFLYIDLDRFKAVNDSFGHAAGDELLRQLGPRLITTLRNSEIVVRLGGDEFGVLIQGQDAEDASGVAQRLVSEIERPFELDGLQAQVSASIGIAYAPASARSAEALIHEADTAMYRAKMGDTSFAVYDHDLDSEGDLWRLTDELRLAVEQGDLELHYQPQLDIRRNEWIGFEALVRWHHPRLGMVPPNRFVPLAEEAGLMGSLTSWVLTTGLDQCLRWRVAGRDVTVSINISPVNLLAPGFVDEVRRALDIRGLAPDALVLEITETSLIENLRLAREVIDELRHLGVIVSIDDFGAGFTSLAYLSELAAGELKLDGTFISRLNSQDCERNVDLVRATIDLGHIMGLQVVAECVEDAPTLKILGELGCDVVQGYLISKPMPANGLSFPEESLVGSAEHIQAG